MTTIIQANGAATLKTDWEANQAYRATFATFDAYYAALDAHRKGFHGPYHPVLMPVQSEIERTLTDFGVTDRLGRSIGCAVSKAMSVVAITEATSLDNTGMTGVEAGTYFVWLGMATRAGKSYGACQSWHWCKTEAEREQQIAKYLKAARSRAVKTAKVAA